MMKALYAIVAAGVAFSLSAQATEYGPEKGTLVIQGGGSAEGTGIYETFVNLAGGPDAKIIIVPTAGGNRTNEGKLIVYEEEKVLASWKKLGLTNVHMLHTADPKVANTEAFAATLRDAKGVWFNGGRQWNCVDSYADTLTLREFREVLNRGGVIGGSSAGATFQGDYLVRGAVAGPQIVMTPEPEHEHGFVFLTRAGIDIVPGNAEVSKSAWPRPVGTHSYSRILVTGDHFRVIG